MSAVTVLIVEKNGNIKEATMKSFDESELYKKAGHTNASGFKCYAQWSIEEMDEASYHISVYGKTTGRANQENKYEFPPPIDTTLFFGNCVIVNRKNNVPASITTDEWDTIYEFLYGGFEDLGDDEDDEEEEDEDDGLPRTKGGYVKDGFVVDDEEEDDEDEYEEQDEEEEYVKKPKTKKATSTKKPNTKTKMNKEKELENIFNIAPREEEDNYLDCTSELSEESYV